MAIAATGGRNGSIPVGPWSMAAVASFVAFFAWLVIGQPDAHARLVTADLVPLAFEALVVVLAAWCARRGRGRERWAWILVACAYSLYLLGDAVWAHYELVQDRSPFPSPADWLYLAFYPVLLAGMLTLPGPLRKRNEWGRLALDVLTVTIASTMTVWYLVLDETLHQAELSLSAVLSVAYPVGDLVLVFGIATVILRGVHPDGSFSLRWMALGASTFVVADIGYAHMNLSGGFESGSWPDLGWILAILCAIIAADGERHRRDSAGYRRRHVAYSRVSVLPYVAIASSYVLLIRVGLSTAAATVRTQLLLVLALTATVVARQVTAVRDGARLTNELLRLAETDPLTKLSNRRHLIDAADHEFAEARRHDDDLALIFIDVDHFKSINDHHGHAVGDAVLIWLSEQLRVILRDTDLVGRFGGDEFVAVVPGLGDQTVLSIAKRLERAVATADSPVEHGPASITISLGVATARGCADLDELLARADAALYQAKRAGRSRARLINGTDVFAGH